MIRKLLGLGSVAPSIQRNRTSDSGRSGASFAEPLEARLLMALARAAGGSGYSANLSSNPTVRQQQLLCDPDEPLRGSTSLQYDPALVHLIGAEPGPGYENESFDVEVEVLVIDIEGGGKHTEFQSFPSFQESPRGPETGFVQVHYQLNSEGEPGELSPDEGFRVVADGGVQGVDTHGLKFQVLEGVSNTTPIPYHVFAANGNTHSGNAEDFLETNDGTHTILHPADLSPADVAGTTSGSGANLGADPSDTSRNALFVNGSDDRDVVRFRKTRGMLEVFDNGDSLGTFKDFTRVIIHTFGGDDDVLLNDAPGVAFGGDGNDVLLMGNQRSILDGGAGLDLLYGGNGDDLLIGGANSDQLAGGNGEDILVAGRTSFDNGSNADIVTLSNIMNEWESGVAYATRIAHITGTPGGVNGTSFFQTTGSSPNVFDDNSADVLLGGNGRDWLILHRNGSTPLDASDLAGNEIGTNV